MRATKILVGAEWLLLIAGCAVLAYCASIVLAARYYQLRAREQLQKSEFKLALASVPSHSARQSSPAPARAQRTFTSVSEVQIPRLHLSAMIAEGDSSSVLRVAVGHVPGTALPGESGNVVLAAHRDTFFRRLGEVKVGDVIRLTIPRGEYSYRVTFTEVVEPRETWVIEPATGETLTLITCYPFHYIGPAPERFVVRARRSDVTSR